MNKPSPPTEARLLDAQAMQTLKEVAVEFAFFNSAASGKIGSRAPGVDFDLDVGGCGRSIRTTMPSRAPISRSNRRRFRGAHCLAIGSRASSRTRLSAQSRRADRWRDGD